VPAARNRTRRGLVAGSAAALAVGALTGGVRATARQSNRDLLDLLRAQEQAQIAHYRALLDAFDDEAFAVAGLPEQSRGRVQAALEADRAHFAALTGAGEGSPEAPAVAIPENLVAALREARELENLAVAAYAYVIPELSQRRLIPELLGMHSVDARHAAWMATLLGEDPFPDAIDAALELEASTPEGAEPLEDPALATPDADVEAEPALAAIASELGVARDDLDVVEVTPQVWPDTSLGCPRPDMLYAQVITPGFQILVDVNGDRIEFHADERGTVVRCP
jgi:hypothetical protein